MSELARYHRYVVDMNQMLARQFRGVLLATGDTNGDIFEFQLMRGDEKLSPTVSPEIRAYFVRSDGTKVQVDGTYSKEGNTATVTLSSECYKRSGRFLLTVKMIGYPAACSTIAMIDGFIRESGTT